MERADAAGRLPSGRVLLVERLGGTSHIHVEAGLHRLMAAVSTEQLPEAGDLVALHVPPDPRVHLFDRDGQSVLREP